MPVESGIRRALRKPPGLDPRDPWRFATPGKVAGDVCPTLPSIACDLYVSVVRACPDHLSVTRRFRNRVDRIVHLGRGVVHRHTARFLLLLLFGIVSGEI